MRDFLSFLTESDNSFSSRKTEGNLEFFTKRQAGARKISAQAKEKGGPSILTHWHFAAKEKPYSEAIRAIKENQDKKWFLSKYKECLNKLEKFDFTQKQFQVFAGELEVWGEVIVKLFE